MSGPAQRGTTKGAVVRPMVEWLAASHGEDAVAAVARALDPKWLAYLRVDAPALGIVHGRWYEEELASAIADAILAYVDDAGESRDDALAGIGQITVERSLGRFARAALWFASPQVTAFSAQMFWRLYHSRGNISASVEGNTMNAIGTGWGLHSRAWCAVVGASSLHVLRLARCVEPRLERHVCTGGTGACEMTLRWSNG